MLRGMNYRKGSFVSENVFSMLNISLYHFERSGLLRGWTLTERKRESGVVGQDL